MIDITRDLLLITNDVFPARGGIARYLHAFATHFSSRIRVYTSEPNSIEVGYSIFHKPLFFLWIWPHWLKTSWLLFRDRVSYRYVITSHVLPIGTAAMVAGWFTKKPYVVIVHGMDVRLAATHARKKNVMRTVFQHAYLVVANSNALAQELQQSYGLSNIVTVYPCVDAVDAVLRPRDVSIPFRLLSVSRLIDRKGHERVLEALALLKLNGSLTQFQYDIVGSGPMEAALKSLTEELGLDSHVRFWGDVDDAMLKERYASAHVFLMPVKEDPIDKEGFGMVFLEAAQYGVPSISTNMSGVNEAIVNGQTGILIQDNDIEGLAQSIHRLSVNEQERQQLGLAAQVRVRSEFFCTTQFAKLDAYLV